MKNRIVQIHVIEKFKGFIDGLDNEIKEILTSMGLSLGMKLDSPSTAE